MKVLICGSRNWYDSYCIYERVSSLPEGAIVIHGGAEGADTIAGEVSTERGLFVAAMPCEEPHWQKYGRSAGHKRNAAMLALVPDLVIAFQRKGSSGTQGTIDNARRLGIPVEIHTGRGGSNG